MGEFLRYAERPCAKAFRNIPDEKRVYRYQAFCAPFLNREVTHDTCAACRTVLALGFPD